MHSKISTLQNKKHHWNQNLHSRLSIKTKLNLHSEADRNYASRDWKTLSALTASSWRCQSSHWLCRNIKQLWANLRNTCDTNLLCQLQDGSEIRQHALAPTLQTAHPADISRFLCCCTFRVRQFHWALFFCQVYTNIICVHTHSSNPHKKNVNIDSYKKIVNFGSVCDNIHPPILFLTKKESTLARQYPPPHSFLEEEEYTFYFTNHVMKIVVGLGKRGQPNRN